MYLSFLSGKRFSQVLSPRTNPPFPQPLPRDTASFAGKIRGNTSEQRARSLRSQTGSIHLLTIVRVRGAHLNQAILPTVARYSVHGESLVCPGLGERSLPSARHSRSRSSFVGTVLLSASCSPRDGAYWWATLLHTGTRRITSARSWGRVRGEEWPPGHRANGWSGRAEAAGC